METAPDPAAGCATQSSPQATLSVIRLTVSRLTVAPYTWSEVRGDLSGGQPPGRQREHDLIDPVEAALPFAHDGRRETAVPVAGYLDVHWPDLG
ncbi:MAG: hypothetical protein QOJ06_558 [Pseudonocardiales bacterium]|jgi:hypothetical protein|nr:hypothetical protein [Pseudonocardiales bacterium]